MIDIHCHILPDIDDGPAEIGTSIKMLEIAAADGITHIAATPHFTYNEKPSVEDIKLGTKLLRDKMDELAIGIKLFSGADIRLTYELLDAVKRKDIPTLNDSRYFLLELPDIIPPSIDNFIFISKTNGLVPVITHPERNYSFLASPEKAEKLKNLGALFQITAISLTGGFGNRIKKLSVEFLRKGIADFIASDAHNTEFRHPKLSEARDLVADILSMEESERLFIKNPLALLSNMEF